MPPVRVPRDDLCVQIPLWTIVTEIRKLDEVDMDCSDSSMDDCNDMGVYLPHDGDGGSDSSMDDCNGDLRLRP